MSVLLHTRYSGCCHGVAHVGNPSIAELCGIWSRCVVQGDLPLAQRNYLQQTCWWDQSPWCSGYCVIKGFVNHLEQTSPRALMWVEGEDQQSSLSQRQRANLSLVDLSFSKEPCTRKAGGSRGSTQARSPSETTACSGGLRSQWESFCWPWQALDRISMLGELEQCWLNCLYCI